MRSACPTAMTTSRLTSRSLPTRSSSLDLASGRITYRSKSKLTVDAVVTFSGFGAGFGGGGGGGACGAGAGGGVGAGSGVAAQPANASRTIADSAVLSLLFMRSSRRLRLEQLGYVSGSLQNARLKLLFLLLTYSATQGHDYSSCDSRIRRAFSPGPGVSPRPTHAIPARVPPNTPGARPGRSRGQAPARRMRPRTGRRTCPARASRPTHPGRARGRRAA